MAKNGTGRTISALYLCVDYRQTWENLSLPERLDRVLDQVEWIIFQASLRGVIVGAKSLVAVIEAKRSMSYGSATENLFAADKAIFDEVTLLGGWKKYNHKNIFSESVLAYICWFAIGQTKLFLTTGSCKMNFDLVYYNYMKPLGSMRQQSPILVRLKEDNDESTLGSIDSDC